MRTGIGLYVKDSAAAVGLYREAFGLELGYHVQNPDGSFYHAELCREGAEMFDVIESPHANPQDNIVQVNMILDGEAEVQKAFDLLSVGGAVDMPVGPLPWSPCAAVLRDRFGVWWYISAPQHYPDVDFDPFASLDTGMGKA